MSTLFNGDYIAWHGRSTFFPPRIIEKGTASRGSP
jgi:hypothetical protein